VEAGAAAVIVVNTEDSLLSPGDNQGGRRDRVRRERGKERESRRCRPSSRRVAAREGQERRGKEREGEQDASSSTPRAA
jgi:hypothetical protein